MTVRDSSPHPRPTILLTMPQTINLIRDNRRQDPDPLRVSRRLHKPLLLPIMHALDPLHQRHRSRPLLAHNTRYTTPLHRTHPHTLLFEGAGIHSLIQPPPINPIPQPNPTTRSTGTVRETLLSRIPTLRFYIVAYLFLPSV